MENSQDKRFLVSLSFAGENRTFVEKVAVKLSDNLGKEKVFYDFSYKSELARFNSNIYLQDIYRKDSNLIVVFLCKNYAVKQWCGLEWRVILEIIMQKRYSDVMPFRFDPSEIEGFLAGDGYIDIADLTPNEVTEYILSRLKTNGIYLNNQSTSKKIRVKLTLDIDLPDFSPSTRNKFIALIIKLLGKKGATIVNIEVGSTIITLEIEEDRLDILSMALYSGLLEKFNPISLTVDEGNNNFSEIFSLGKYLDFKKNVSSKRGSNLWKFNRIRSGTLPALIDDLTMAEYGGIPMDACDNVRRSLDRIQNLFTKEYSKSTFKATERFDKFSNIYAGWNQIDNSYPLAPILRRNTIRLLRKERQLFSSEINSSILELSEVINYEKINNMLIDNYSFFRQYSNIFPKSEKAYQKIFKFSQDRYF